jgi:hypothetical protein
LLRLGGTLKVACDELARFTRNQSDFSRKRFSFFLNRAWLLSKGLAKALREQNDAEFERLKWIPANKPLTKLELVTLGVSKKVVTNAFCAFDFRLRCVDTECDEIAKGQKFIWSCVFPMKPGSEIPAEGYLHLPQKQSFNAVQFIEGGKKILVENCSTAVDAFGSARLTFTEQTTVAFGDAYEAWDSHLTWDAEKTLEKLRAHQPTPLELDNELQEEVVFDEWSIQEEVDDPEQDQIVFPVLHKDMVFKAVVSRGVDGTTLLHNLKAMQVSSKKPRLFALLHYEKCRLVLQPLSTFESNKDKSGKVVTTPKHLMIGKDQINRAALLKALRF